LQWATPPSPEPETGKMLGPRAHYYTAIICSALLILNSGSGSFRWPVRVLYDSIIRYSLLAPPTVVKIGVGVQLVWLALGFWVWVLGFGLVGSFLVQSSSAV